MSSPSFHVGKVDDSLEAYLSIAGEALLSSDRANWQLYVDRIGSENIRIVRRGSQVAGGMAFYRMGQWFGGRAIPCAGFSGVAISPSDRGTGACAELLTSVLRELHSEGLAIASLYASTQYLYRTVGFEQAGTQTNLSIPIASIHCNDRALQAHRFLSPPLGVLQRIAEARAEISNGNIQRTEGLWQRLLKPYDCSGTITYVIGDIDAAQGFAIFRSGARERSHPQPLISTDVVALTGAASRRLLTLVRDHRSMCDSFEWFGPPDDTLPLFANEQFVKVKAMMRWLLRIVSLPAALAQRGYDADLSGELHLEVRDELLPENSGRWILRVEGGRGEVRARGRRTARDGHSLFGTALLEFPFGPNIGPSWGHRKQGRATDPTRQSNLRRPAPLDARAVLNSLG